MLLAASQPQLAVAAPSKVDVIHYRARIEPDLAGRRLTGQETLSLRLPDGGDTIELDRGEMTIDAVREAGKPLQFSQQDRRLVIGLPRTSRPNTRHDIRIDYHAAPRFGLEFQSARTQLYTIFSTSQWLVAVDAPGDRATLDLELVLPARLRAVGNGRALGSRPLADGRVLHRWRQDRPVPSYTFGFAAGTFDEVVERRHDVQLHYLADGFTPATLRRIFADTGDMLQFFTRRAGVSYADDRYTQVLVAETIGQELSGFALMSEHYGREVATDPRAEALIAHEAAHQWWGNRITCASWNHFWLNEGFANFMTAAYLEHRFGRDAYLQQVDGWRKRLERLRSDGKDKPLVFPEWTQPTGDDRAVVYQKGAYVLHLLRERMGEDAFWKGLRAYSREHVDQAVVTPDFQRAMQAFSDVDLSPFFSEWVYEPGRAVAKAMRQGNSE